MTRRTSALRAGLLVLPLALLLGCPEYTLRPNEQTDVFLQETRNVVDILLVVDNSCSMIDEQEKLADNFQSFIDAFAGVDVDYQIGVVTTDQEQEHHMGRLRCAADVVGDASGPFEITTGSNDTLILDFGDGEISATIPGGTYTASQLADWISWQSPMADYAFAVASNADAIWITTETPCEDAYLEVGGGTVNDTIGIEEGYSMTGVRLITLETENPAAHFAANVHVGDRGSGFEQGLQGAFLALSEPLLTGENDGILRDDAALSLVFVSDEEDQSPDPVSYYLDYYYAVKSPVDGWEAYRDDTLLDISAVVGDIPDGCEQQSGEDVYPAAPGYRYIDLAQRTGGVYDSICNEDFSPLVYELGLNISGLRSEFHLSRFPDELTLVVRVVPEGGTAEEVQEGWIYDCEENRIVFDEDHVPQSQHKIEVSYTVVPHTGGDGCGGAEG